MIDIVHHFSSFAARVTLQNIEQAWKLFDPCRTSGSKDPFFAADEVRAHEATNERAEAVKLARQFNCCKRSARICQMERQVYSRAAPWVLLRCHTDEELLREVRVQLAFFFEGVSSSAVSVKEDSCTTIIITRRLSANG